MHSLDRTDTLVCGVDDSAHAATVAGFAAALAHRLGLRLRLVHSVHPDGFLAGDDRRHALRRGEELLDTLAPDQDAGAGDRVVELGDPVELVLSVLGEGTELAVVGSRGRGPGRAALLGSVSNALAVASPCPVIVVPHHASHTIPADPAIVCGIDGSPAADTALERAALLARALGGHLVAVHVRAGALTPHATSLMPGRQPFDGSIDDERTAVSTLERPLTELDLDLPVDMRVETGYAAARLAAVAAEEHATMLVVGSRRRAPVPAAVFGSVSSRLAAGSPVPVMIVAARDANRAATAL
jgi:nucleotide-binding universal stress UspA family protein